MYSLHPFDDFSNDWIPALDARAVPTGVNAIARLVGCRLRLFRGDWWEQLNAGNRILDMISSIRLSEASLPNIVSYLSDYIAETPGVITVQDANAYIRNAYDHSVDFTCTVVTEEGTATINYSF